MTVPVWNNRTGSTVAWRLECLDNHLCETALENRGCWKINLFVVA